MAQKGVDMAVKFNQVIKHDKCEFLPDVAVAFDDPDAERYFIAAGWASATSDDPVRTYSVEEVVIDPETVHGGGPNKGDKVLGD